jgi:hypothetical protein
MPRVFMWRESHPGEQDSNGTTSIRSETLTDWQGLLDTLSTHGPQQLIDQIRHAEYTDTQPRPRHKPHDDASVIFCSFEPEDP